jgi:hypothetical protein
MKASDVTDTLEMALAAEGLDREWIGEFSGSLRNLWRRIFVLTSGSGKLADQL